MYTYCIRTMFINERVSPKRLYKYLYLLLLFHRLELTKAFVSLKKMALGLQLRPKTLISASCVKSQNSLIFNSYHLFYVYKAFFKKWNSIPIKDKVDMPHLKQ